MCLGVPNLLNPVRPTYHVTSLRKCWHQRQQATAKWHPTSGLADHKKKSVLKRLKRPIPNRFLTDGVLKRQAMRWRRKDLGGAHDGKTKLANCVFLWSWQWGDPKGELMTVVVSGIRAKFPWLLLKLPPVHSHHVISNICRAILELYHYQGLSSLWFPLCSMLLSRFYRNLVLVMGEKSVESDLKERSTVKNNGLNQLQKTTTLPYKLLSKI